MRKIKKFILLVMATFIFMGSLNFFIFSAEWSCMWTACPYIRGCIADVIEVKGCTIRCWSSGVGWREIQCPIKV
ncbi:hypothetical protein NLB65_00150 [Candidatus Aminicenantes bacterium AC-335-B20]|jgi:hypothetical protein|nr:hypothetical protein [SCandidatus Aminicenantes bacterium Aminicenantia_JdfR_composite]MCP2598542.1 hypothetical protein [Candidatus Aminicenantes bacterium AC-335-L06]MCP2598855.1 hypothetical protein [Candidatus Aminicenantes bacterium AC-335-B20]